MDGPISLPDIPSPPQAPKIDVGDLQCALEESFQRQLAAAQDTATSKLEQTVADYERKLNISKRQVEASNQAMLGLSEACAEAEEASQKLAARLLAVCFNKLHRRPL